MDVTKEQFENIYNLYTPNKWTILAFKYFSTSTLKKDLKPRMFFIYSWMTLFSFGFLGTLLKLPRIFIGIPTFLLGGILILLGIFLLGAGIMNNRRIRKIRKILGLSKTEYNKLVNKYESV